MRVQKLLTLFSLILAFLFVSACAAEEFESFDGSFDSGEERKNDFDGFEIVYLLDPITHWSGGINHDMFLGYDAESNFADLARARVNQVRQDYNCKITVKNQTGLHTYVKPIIMSGGYAADACAGISDMWGDYARLGCFVGLSEVSDYIDITDEEKWGYKAFVETMYVDNDLYGVVPMAWPDLVSTNFGYPIIFNGTLISVLGQNDPREYSETGKWNYDQFFECLRNYTVQEGGETKTYGFLCGKRLLAQVFLYSNGAENVQQDGDTFSFGLHGYLGQAGMEAATRLVFGDMKYTYDKAHEGLGTVDFCNRFLENRDVMAAFYVGNVFGADGLVSTQMDNYGFMPWPHGNNVPDDFTFGLIENIYTGVTLPVTGKDSDATAQILDLIYEPLEGYETYEKIVAYMTRSYFFDDRDARTFFSMFENCRYNYFHYLGERPYLYLESTNTSIAQFIESAEREIDDLFEKEVMRAVNGVIATHGSYFYDRDN